MGLICSQLHILTGLVFLRYLRIARYKVSIRLAAFYLQTEAELTSEISCLKTVHNGQCQKEGNVSVIDDIVKLFGQSFVKRKL